MEDRWKADNSSEKEVTEMALYDPKEDDYGDRDIPEVDTEPYKDGFYVEPLPESTRPRRDVPGGD